MINTTVVQSRRPLRRAGRAFVKRIRSVLFASSVAGFFTAGSFAQGAGPAEIAAKQTRTIESGHQYETCSKSWGGKRVSYSFVATQALEFEVHRHYGKALDKVVYFDATAGFSGSFVADRRGQYCLLWTNLTPRAIVIEFQFAAQRR